MNNVIMRKVTVQASYTNLASRSLVGTVTISAHPGNAGDVSFKGDDGNDVPWGPGERHEFKSIDLAGIQIKGTPGDIVTVVGGAW